MVVNNCKSLTLHKIISSPCISASVISSQTIKSLDSLRALTAVWKRSTCDTTIRYRQFRCHHLLWILTECFQVSAATIKAIGTYAPGVKELMLSYCYHVTEDALLHVLANCKSLLQLIVSGLQSVTDRVVEAAKSHPTLTLLNASSCPYVSQSFKKSPRNSKLSIIL